MRLAWFLVVLIVPLVANNAQTNQPSFTVVLNSGKNTFCNM